jgi:Lon protease-like protein
MDMEMDMDLNSDEDELPGPLLAALGDLPVFPLPQAVLFPRALLPLHIFEPRYRAMLAHCLGTHRAMVIARIADEGDVDAEGRPRFACVAGLGVIVQHRALPDGRSNIVLHGRARVSIEEHPSDTPYRCVRATILTDVETTIADADRTALLATATAFAGELHKHTSFDLEFPPDATADAIADLCAQHLVFDADARQAVLEERDVAARIRRVTTELALQQQKLLRKDGEDDAPGKRGGKRDKGRSSLN